MFIGTLKYYFKDYKNYVYVPDENLLLPKALSTSIDKSRIQKATKEQCFAAKEGMFLPNLLKLDEREFKKDFSSKETYIEIDPKEVSFRFLENYIQKIIVP